MAVSRHSYQFLLERDKGEHDVVNDALIVILLGETFVFDPAVHATYSDIQSFEIAAGYGYLQKSKLLEGVGLSIQTTEERVFATCVNPVWQVSGGDWPGVRAAAIINDSHINDTVVLCIDFETIYTLTDGLPFELNFSNGIYAARIFTPA